MARYLKDFAKADKAIAALIAGTSAGITERLAANKLIDDPVKGFLAAADFAEMQLRKLEMVERQYVHPHSLRLASEDMAPMIERIASARQEIKARLAGGPGQLAANGLE